MDTKKFGFVSLVGVPNAGKTTLMNQLVQFKVGITSPKPQTTRNKIYGIKTGENYQIVYIDHPGYHIPKSLLNKAMQKIALTGLKDVDLILHVIDSSKKLADLDLEIIEILKKVEIKKFIVLNKIDLIKKNEVLPLIDDISKRISDVQIFPVSALKGENLKELEEEIIKNLPEGEFLYEEDKWTTQRIEFYISEIIREKIINLTKDEIPHCIAVEIEKIEELKEKNLIRIFSSIWVEKESQKPIIIGRGGNMIKEIGKRAREELEAFFGAKVYLELFVKVKKNWRQDPNSVYQVIEKI